VTARRERPRDVRPNRADLELGPMFFTNALHLARLAEADDLDSLSTKFPADCCDGSNAQARPRMVASSGELASTFGTCGTELAP
jgi:hypothetical protein